MGIEIDGEWSPCWLWLGAVSNSGYALVTLWDKKKKRNRQHNAHRVSKTAHTGEKVSRRAVLRHLCHRQTCIHPNHTVPGSQYENVQDQYARGTHVNQWAERAGRGRRVKTLTVKSYKGPGIYQHYKGQSYFVLGLSKHTESGEKCVVYRPLYLHEDGWQYFVHRPMDQFCSLVEKEKGVFVPRFERLRRPE